MNNNLNTNVEQQNQNNAQIPVTTGDTMNVETQNVQQVNQQSIEQTNATIQTNTNNVQTQNQLQNQLQSIPTVEQNPEQFINNVQTQNQEKKEEKKEGPNFVFIMILFGVILLSIIFLFPILAKYI